MCTLCADLGMARNRDGLSLNRKIENKPGVFSGLIAKKQVVVKEGAKKN